MQLAVFGATGRTGEHIVIQALDEGHEVTAFVRDRAKLERQQGTPDRLHAVEGTVQNAVQVSEAVDGTDAVLSALGHTSSSTKDVQTVGTQHMLTAMNEHDVQRIVSETGAGVRHEKDEPHLGSMVMSGLLGLVQPSVLRDAEDHAEVLRASDREWIIVRAPRLTNGPRTGQYRTGYLKMGPRAKISRADVADFMLTLASGDTYVREAPMICY